MVDFLMIATRSPKRGVVEIYPKFIIKSSADLMIRGGDFYAVWVAEKGLWSTDEQDALNLIDRELDIYAEKHSDKFDGLVRVLHMWDSESGMIDSWHKYCQKQMRDRFHPLDEKLIFTNSPVCKKDYASKRLDYPLEKGSIDAYDRLMSVIYSKEERQKIEWAIGSIVNGDSKKIQKFLVLYGAAGTGKSTVLNIIQKLFDGYYSVFDAKALGSSNNSFALEAFRTNPLVAIQHDGDLSHIEDNTRLNSLVSHEYMTVNEKFKSTYTSRFQCFLFMGTNKPVRITDAKSGLIRRLIDVTPSGNKLPPSEYRMLIKRIGFEIGAIAWHCREVYEADPERYNDYVPINMMGASNDFFNFVQDAFFVFKRDDKTTLRAAWEMYKAYCDDAKVSYPLSQRAFKEELKSYFRDFTERLCMEDGSRARSVYSGFRSERFEKLRHKEQAEAEGLVLDCQTSVLDKICADCPAQYAVNDIPQYKWANVRTRLCDIDTSKVHYVKLPQNHIVVDFDIQDEQGNKSLEKNLLAAAQFPPTYAELSKSGSGVHLHYIYTGDPNELSRVYGGHIEIKVFSGESSLRRKLTFCNNLDIAEINSGLPKKGEKKTVVSVNAIKSERGLRMQIERNLAKEIHADTRSSVDFIAKILEDAFNSGMAYDISDMRGKILAFAAGSTHQSAYCIKRVSTMKFKSEKQIEQFNDSTESDAKPIAFFDIEVFPNLFLVCYKQHGENKPVVRMINPLPADIEALVSGYRLIGFNCRRYDNHLLYGCLIGYSNEELYALSQKIISGDKNAFFGEAYNVSYTDVYDFASAGNKKSLKKLEIEMGIHHQELGLPWDKPVSEELWDKVAEYCDNDVEATESAFNYLNADWTARQILADLAGMTVNDTTNTLTQRIIFGKNKAPQNEFRYRSLAEPVYELDKDTLDFLRSSCPEMISERHGDKQSLLPYFEGYTYENGISTYLGENVGEGGYVYAEPGIYHNVALLDIASMHPHSAIAEVLFGVRYTKAFRDIVEGRVSIKHEDWSAVNNMLDGKLTPYIQKVTNGELSSKQLANALKTAINSVYGLTSASFDNPFRDIRNKDNIVAKRGALFMVNLKNEVQKRGFTVAHIKTDSIKIPNATPEIIEFVMKYGKRYGYTFEHEATYERMCLVNNAVYIAKYADGKWTATGTQFAVPYVFKKLFSKEEIVFDDLCETKSVNTALYLDMNENLPDGEHDYHFVGKVGRFCPIKADCGGGVLLRQTVDKDGNNGYASVTGTKGQRWLEAEMVKTAGHESNIDRTYYDRLVSEAVEAISKFGDFEQFVSEEEPPEWPPEITRPFSMPCGRDKCTGCEHFSNDAFHVDCALGYDVFPF